MCQIGDAFERGLKNPVAPNSGDIGDEAYAAGVALVFGPVQQPG
jgi:hypothetical protein